MQFRIHKEDLLAVQFPKSGQRYFYTENTAFNDGVNADVRALDHMDGFFKSNTFDINGIKHTYCRGIFLPWQPKSRSIGTGYG